MEGDRYVLDSGYEAFERRAELNSHVASLAFAGLRRRPLAKLLVDCTADRRELRGGMFLAVALELSRMWRNRLAGERVGVVFPAGLGGMMANLALGLMDRVPVNLNFTAGRVSVGHAIAMAELQTLISARPVKERVSDFPWPADFVDLLQERARINQRAVLRHFLKILLLPNGVLQRLYNVPQAGGRREAGLLFSSGSTGNPKGIVLSHRNVIANCLQIKECELLNHTQVLLSYLPIFHSFGFTVTMWYPLIAGMRTVLMPSPLETRRIAEVIEQEKITVMIGTPTFLRPYFQRARPEQLASLKFVVAGAEKTPAGFGERWEAHFGSEYIEGYGLTETSPVVSANLPARPDKPAEKRTASVGRPMCGMRIRVVDTMTGEILPRNQRGMLEVKGANVFSGYLKDPDATRAAFHDGWFVTGDLGRIDEDGYLFIEGRVSRFSKLGGEMVPHGRVEQVIAQQFGLEDAEHPLVAVTGIEDEQKGEALVVLAAVELDANLVRERLLKAGLPVLWIPKIIRRVDQIPCLASGKLDLQALNLLARERTQPSAESPTAVARATAGRAR